MMMMAMMARRVLMQSLIVLVLQSGIICASGSDGIRASRTTSLFALAVPALQVQHV